MSSDARRFAAFTLIELMITVALIGVLTAIAIPNFLAYQAKARRGEAYSNLVALARAEKAHYAERDVFPDISVTGEPSLPDPSLYGGLGIQKMPWDAAASAFFDPLGWQPEGRVHYSYEARSQGCGCTACFTLAAHGDVDGDGAVSSILYVHPETSGSGAVTGQCATYLGGGLSAPLDPVTGFPLYDQVAANLLNDDF